MGHHTFGVSLGVGIPTCAALVESAVLFAKTKAVSAFLQLLGAGGLLMVVMGHAAEAFGLMPWMQWGLADSAGHYFDLAGAVLGLTAFPTGYLLYAVTLRTP